MILEIVSCIFGFFLSPLLSIIGILSEKEGIEYYGEIHQSFENKIIHFIFMIPTSFSVLLIIPSVFNISIINNTKVLKSIYIIYITHYITIDIISGIIMSIIYQTPFILANNIYSIENRFTCLKNGIIILLSSLFIQEFFGHFLFEQKQSRLEGIFNAILYAPFYSVYEFSR